MAALPAVLSVAIVGCARSNRGNVWPDVHANGPSPQSREPLPEKAPEVNGLNRTTMLSLLKLAPKSVELAKAAPSEKLLPSDLVPPGLAFQETYTWPLGPMPIFAPSLLQIVLIFIGVLTVAR